MNQYEEIAPNSSAVRTALSRALHLEVDDPPYVFEDDIGVKLIAANALAQRYFSTLTDGLRLQDNSEELLVAST